MNRRELLKSLPAVAALLPVKSDKGLEYKLEEGPFYLFVLNPSAVTVHEFVKSFDGLRCRGAVVVAHDCDVNNFCRIYKIDEND